MNVWVMDSDSGITMLYFSKLDFPVNEDLVSGLLTAINQFAEIEFGQSIESLDMAGLRWVYVADKEAKLLFIAAATKDINAEMLRARLNVIKHSFIQAYVKDNENWDNTWTGNNELFLPFKATIEEYYSHWKQAETITTVAEFFDILGVFQQILNLTMNIVSRLENQQIYDRIEQMINSFSDQEQIKIEPELSKISFDRNIGFNIISINPNNCDMLIVEKNIINLIKTIIKIIKVELGHSLSIQYFIEENILDYIMSNFQLLNELNLILFLLRLFLLK
ncbi:unnamed protein product [marine sediment metagenome]|uniref:FUZ/MON1/HPS1 first Longin domain-containing protein n=1 Tax=marine sediment metagenome TaxID=412755 RepID=X0YPW8_9ZZZZ